MNVDVTLVRYFVHVATAGSFGKGAAQAFVSPPAISKAIRKLEEALGVSLFERTTRRVSLTPAGHTVLERARRVLMELDAIEADLALADGRPRGTLRIAAMEVFSIDLLPTALCALTFEHPEVLPQCYEMIPERMIDRLAHGEIDVAFTIGAKPVNGIEAHPLGISKGALVCGRRHALYKRGRVSQQNLTALPSVVPRFFGAEHLPSLDAFPEEHYIRRVGATIELLQMGVSMCLSGGYLGYFPEVSVRKHLADKSLRALQGLQHGEPFRLFALTRAATPIKPAAADLIARVRRSLRNVGHASGQRHPAHF